MTAAATNTAPVASDMPPVNEVRRSRQGRHYSVAHLGRPADLGQYGVSHPLLKRPLMGKAFLKEPLGLTGMEISFGVLPAHAAVPFQHRHRQNEEVYLFLQGKGQMLIDGEVVEVEEGTAVRVAPDGVRCWRNTSSQDLFYVVIQAKEGSLTAWTRSDGVGVQDGPAWPETA